MAQRKQQREAEVLARFTVALTTKPKYELAFKAATDIVSIAGDVALSGINQAADTPDYQQGVKGYAQRFGASYVNSFSNVMIGGGVLPSLLHQDPRYFFQGTGSGRSRAMHAIASPFVCRGDNSHRQFNISSIGGDLISSSMTNLLLPCEQSRTRIGFVGHAHQHRGPDRQRSGTGIHPAQVYEQRQPSKLRITPRTSVAAADKEGPYITRY